MPPEESYTDLGLIGINAGFLQNSEQPTIYSPQLPLEPGFHLRWQLRQGLGLPKRFLIYRTNQLFGTETNQCGEFESPYCKSEEEQLFLLQTDIHTLNEPGP